MYLLLQKKMGCSASSVAVTAREQCEENDQVKTDLNRQLSVSSNIYVAESEFDATK